MSQCWITIDPRGRATHLRGSNTTWSDHPIWWDDCYWGIFPFAVGIGLFGVDSYRTPELSNTFAVALLAISATYFIVLGDGLWNGFPNSQSVLFATVVIQTGALFAIGYLLYTE